MTGTPDTQARISGEQHEMLMRVGRDARHAIKVLPGLIRFMLEGERWRSFTLKDGKTVRHATLTDWITKEAREGLGFASWDELYSVLTCSEAGMEAATLLHKAGGPDPAPIEGNAAMETMLVGWLEATEAQQAEFLTFVQKEAGHA